MDGSDSLQQPDMQLIKEEQVQPSVPEGQPQQEPPQEEDAKSDTSFDPLFDEADGDEMGFQNQPQPAQEATKLSIPGPSTSQPSLPSTRQTVGTGAAAPAPRNAPPVLDPLSYTMFSSDVLLTASIDGQVMLWDRRVHTPGRGVGRLWMSEKTPPWCVSVSRECFS
jgi:transcriptional activator SPT8